MSNVFAGHRAGVSRRRFVQGLAAGGALAGFGHRFAFTAPLSASMPVLAGTEFALSIGESPVHFTGRSRPAITVNGSLPAPTLRGREGATVIITSHIMEEVQRLGDRVVYMEDGRLRFTLPPELIAEATGEKSLSAALPKYIAQLPPQHVEGL